MKRLGRINISFELLDNYKDNLVEAFAQLGLLTLDVETFYYSRSANYLMYCKDFDEVPEGVSIPDYIIECVSTPAGNVEYSVRKV